MPYESDIEKRDGAVVSLKLKHVDLCKEYVNQDPKEVDTKFSKRIDTYFFPVSDEIKTVFIH